MIKMHGTDVKISNKDILKKIYIYNKLPFRKLCPSIPLFYGVVSSTNCIIVTVIMKDRGTSHRILPIWNLSGGTEIKQDKHELM